jgi:hypothetical protein
LERKHVEAELGSTMPELKKGQLDAQVAQPCGKSQCDNRTLSVQSIGVELKLLSSSM